MDLHTDWVVLNAECGGQSAEWSVQWVQECRSTGVLSAGCRAQEWCCVLLAGDRAKRPDDVDTYIRVEKSGITCSGVNVAEVCCVCVQSEDCTGTL